MRHGVTIVTSMLLLTLLGCHSAEEKARLERKEQQRQLAASDLANLRSRYNPVVDWPQQLKERTYTIDVEPIFVRSDDRPSLFYGTLDDVRRNNDGILLYFSTTPTEREPTIQLILDCASCNLGELERPANSIGDFAVVAQITAATKSIDESKDAPDYVLRGKLVDERFVGYYAIEQAAKERRQ
jgi:hypothetical protein